MVIDGMLMESGFDQDCNCGSRWCGSDMYLCTVSINIPV